MSADVVVRPGGPSQWSLIPGAVLGKPQPLRHMRSTRRSDRGDFRTPDSLALSICHRLKELGIDPTVILDPACGVGAFMAAGAEIFPSAELLVGIDIDGSHVGHSRIRLADECASGRVRIDQGDFFRLDWDRLLPGTQPLLVMGNPPWVTNSALGRTGSTNLPTKSNHSGAPGIAAITGSSNFDISESILKTILEWFSDRTGWVAVLVKTAVARRVLAEARRCSVPVVRALQFDIDARLHFRADVSACLLVLKMDPYCVPSYDMIVHRDLDSASTQVVATRGSTTVSDVATFDAFGYMFGTAPERWRSGVKHDAASVMELIASDGTLVNSVGEAVDDDENFVFPLMKGSDVARGQWRDRYVVVTQRHTGDCTRVIQARAPRLWQYLETHSERFQARRSKVYQDAPPYSMFGVGPYAFRPWKIAIAALYKAFSFRLVGPIRGRPVMFDDTVYYVSFDTEEEARRAYHALTTEAALRFLSALTFFDEKRPIKASILNVCDWSQAPVPLEGSSPGVLK